MSAGQHIGRGAICGALAFSPVVVSICGIFAYWNPYVLLLLFLAGWTLCYTLYRVVKDGKPRALSTEDESAREGMVSVVDYEGRVVGSMGVEPWQSILSTEDATRPTGDKE